MCSGLKLTSANKIYRDEVSSNVFSPNIPVARLYLTESTRNPKIPLFLRFEILFIILWLSSLGWGRTVGGGNAAITLQDAVLPVSDIHSCSKINGRLIAVDDKTMLCAGGEGIAGGCQVG